MGDVKSWILQYVSDAESSIDARELGVIIDIADSWDYEVDGDGGLENVTVTFGGVVFTYCLGDGWESRSPAHWTPYVLAIEKILGHKTGVTCGKKDSNQ